MAVSNGLLQDIRRLPCLTAFDEADLAILVKYSSILKIRKGAVLFEEGGEVDYFYVIRCGSIKLVKSSGDGKQYIVKIMRSGEFFCCAPMFTGGKHYVTASAMENSEAMAMPSDRVRGMLFGELGEKGRKILAGLCDRIRLLSNHIENLTFRGVEQRVMITLYMLSEGKGTDNGAVRLSVTHQDMASMVGSVREVVSRSMKKLKKQGAILESNVKGIKVDRAALADCLRKSENALS